MNTSLTPVEKCNFAIAFLEYLKEVYDNEGSPDLTEEYFEDLKEIAGNSDMYSCLKEKYFDEVAIDFKMNETMRLINYLNKEMMDCYGSRFEEDWTEYNIISQTAYWFIHKISLEEFKEQLEEVDCCDICGNKATAGLFNDEFLCIGCRENYDADDEEENV